MTGARQVALLVLALSAGPGLAQELGGPAELPPPDFAGQQYVDSKGCLFARAGTPGKVVWVPRVTRDGQRLCGNPPSGRRVPVAEEDGIAAIPEAAPATGRRRPRRRRMMRAADISSRWAALPKPAMSPGPQTGCKRWGMR